MQQLDHHLRGEANQEVTAALQLVQIAVGPVAASLKGGTSNHRWEQSSQCLSWFCLLPT
jgi:hypothetical protein